MRNKKMISKKQEGQYKEMGLSVFSTAPQKLREKYGKRIKVWCKICRNNIKLDIMVRHMRKVHGILVDHDTLRPNAIPHLVVTNDNKNYKPRGYSKSSYKTAVRGKKPFMTHSCGVVINTGK